MIHLSIQYSSEKIINASFEEGFSFCFRGFFASVCFAKIARGDFVFVDSPNAYLQTVSSLFLDDDFSDFDKRLRPFLLDKNCLLLIDRSKIRRPGFWTKLLDLLNAGFSCAVIVNSSPKHLERRLAFTSPDSLSSVSKFRLGYFLSVLFAVASYVCSLSLGIFIQSDPSLINATNEIMAATQKDQYESAIVTESLPEGLGSFDSKWYYASVLSSNYSDSVHSFLFYPNSGSYKTMSISDGLFPPIIGYTHVKGLPIGYFGFKAVAEEDESALLSNEIILSKNVADHIISSASNSFSTYEDLIGSSVSSSLFSRSGQQTASTYLVKNVVLDGGDMALFSYLYGDFVIISAHGPTTLDFGCGQSVIKKTAAGSAIVNVLKCLLDYETEGLFSFKIGCDSASFYRDYSISVHYDQTASFFAQSHFTQIVLFSVLILLATICETISILLVKNDKFNRRKLFFHFSGFFVMLLCFFVSSFFRITIAPGTSLPLCTLPGILLSFSLAVFYFIEFSLITKRRTHA